MSRATLAVTGLIVGAMSSIFGIGGGFLIVSFLVVHLRTTIKDAITVSLGAVALITAVSATSHSIVNAITPGFELAFLLSGAILGALAGTYATTLVSQRTLRITFAIMLVLAAILLFNGPIGTFDSSTLVIIGSIAGFASALLGISGGVLLMPALIGSGFGFLQAVSLTLATTAPTALIAFALRRPEREAIARAGLIALAALIGIGFGTIISPQLSEGLLRTMLAGILLFYAVNMALPLVRERSNVIARAADH